MSAPPPEPGRRLGERIPVGDVLLVWRAAAEDHRPRRRTRQDPHVGRLVNVSVSGAAVVAPTAGDLRPGSVVLVQLGDARAAVRIKRIDTFGDDDWRIYGVEFVETEPEFRDWVNHLLGGRRDAGLIEAWNRAH